MKTRIELWFFHIFYIPKTSWFFYSKFFENTWNRLVLWFHLKKILQSKDSLKNQRIALTRVISYLYIYYVAKFS